MEIRSWDPNAATGRRNALKLIDRTIYEPLFRERSRVGDLPSDLEPALQHCSRQLQVRSDMTREELEIDAVDWERQPQREELLDFRPARPNLVSGPVPASRRPRSTPPRGGPPRTSSAAPRAHRGNPRFEESSTWSRALAIPWRNPTRPKPTPPRRRLG